MAPRAVNDQIERLAASNLPGRGELRQIFNELRKGPQNQP